MRRYTKEELGKMKNSVIKYLYSKFILYLQISSVKNCDIGEKVKLGHRSNLINVKIDKYSYIGNNNSISNVEIGKFCSIASYCAIGGGEHFMKGISTSPIFFDKNNVFNTCLHEVYYEGERKTYIGNDVWIGENCFIKAGVHIGNGAIIGAHTVVTKDIPPYAVVAGNPSRVLYYRFSQEIIDQLENIEWWEFDWKTMKEAAQFFDKPELFIKKYKNERGFYENSTY